MAITKNKILLRDKSLSLKNEMDLYESSWYSRWGDYDDDYRFDHCDCPECSDYWGGRCIYEGTWEYLNDVFVDYQVISRGRSWRRLGTANKTMIGRIIDMNSIYSKEVLREKKINQLLGLEYDYSKPTLADIFPKNIN